MARKIGEAAAEGRFNTLLGEFNVGYLAEEDVLRSVGLFGEEVMPRLASPSAVAIGEVG